MRKIYSFILLSLFSLTLQAQTYVLDAENFETPSTINSSLNDTSFNGIANGPNRWIINDKYDGLSIYPNTPRQDSTYLGTIYNAPYSTYLHVHDTLTATATSDTIANSNFDPTIASENFVIVDQTGVCTIGFDTVYVSFYYTCVGSPDAYAELYYSTDGGGSWTQIGQPKYNNRDKWQYEILTYPGFLNAENLMFGFRWVNNSGTPPATTSFGIDDFVIAGHAAPVPTSITLTPFNDTICVGRYMFLTYNLTSPMCDGLYQIEMSDLTGSFISPASFGVFTIQAPFTIGGIGLFIPNSVFPGNCYRFTLRRLAPLIPPIFIDTTICIVIEHCPDTIQTCPIDPLTGFPMVPTVTLDSNDVCAGSVIDVKFHSKGSFILNTYKLQLSDVNGNFVHPDSAGAIIIGSKQTDNSYDPSFPTPGDPPPGSVGGLIPDTMSPGCNYYVRIIATGPALPPPPLVGSEWGPFCIQHCDIITNNMQDVINTGLCLLDTPVCRNISIDVNYYDTTASAITYGPGNQFMVQVLSSTSFTPVGPLGILGSVFATGDTTLKLCVGPLDSMLTWGILPSTLYYLRIIATSSSNPENSLGSVIRFMYGFKIDYTPIVEILDFLTGQPVTHACVGQIIQYRVTNPPPPPLDNLTSYQWTGPFVGSPSVRKYPGEDLLIQFTGLSNYIFTITCRQYSHFNCFGPLATISLPVYAKPNINIIGPSTICLGDTVKYRTAVQGETFFMWSDSSSHAILTDTASNEAWFTFDSVGTYQIYVYASNPCFDTSGFRTLTVKKFPDADLGLDSMTICTGTPITLVTSPVESGWTFQWTANTTSLGNNNDSLTQSPTSTTTYTVAVTNPPACTRKDSIEVIIEYPPETDFTDSICVDGTPIVLDAGTAQSYDWNTGDTTQQDTVTAAGTYTVELQVSGEVCYRIYTYTVGDAFPDSSEQDVLLCYGDPLILDATEPGGDSYLWDTQETSPQLSIDKGGTYSVTITLATRRCSITKTFYATDSPDLCERDFKLPNVFTPDNGDPLNDEFQALTYGNYRTFLIKIFNRWGELVFESTDPSFKWDGTNQDGKQCTPGVYYYVGNISHPSDTRVLHGFVTLIRDEK